MSRSPNCVFNYPLSMWIALHISISEKILKLENHKHPLHYCLKKLIKRPKNVATSTDLLKIWVRVILEHNKTNALRVTNHYSPSWLTSKHLSISALRVNSLSFLSIIWNHLCYFYANFFTLIWDFIDSESFL